MLGRPHDATCEDPEIAALVAAEADLDEACERLVALANARGGEDNITVALVRCEENEQSALAGGIPPGARPDFATASEHCGCAAAARATVGCASSRPLPS